MIDHLTAIKNRLAPLGDVYLQEAVKYGPDGTREPLSYPYLIVWSTNYRPGVETALDAQNRDITATFAITAVAGTPEGAAIVAERAKAILGGETWQPLNVLGRIAYTRWSAFQTMQTDRDVKLPLTNRHPTFQVDIYHLDSTPNNQ